MITQERMEKAVMFLSETDQELARRKAYFNGLDRQTKTVKAMAFMRSGESSVTAKEQAALVSPAYRDHLQRVTEAEQEFLTLNEQRHTEVIVIDCWRSLNAARNRGQF